MPLDCPRALATYRAAPRPRGPALVNPVVECLRRAARGGLRRFDALPIQDRDDIAQDTSVKVLAMVEAEQARPRKELGLARTMARNKAVDAVRRRQRSRERRLPWEVEADEDRDRRYEDHLSDGWTPLEALEHREEALAHDAELQALAAALPLLSARDRALLERVYLDEVPIQALADEELQLDHQKGRFDWNDDEAVEDAAVRARDRVDQRLSRARKRLALAFQTLNGGR